MFLAFVPLFLGTASLCCGGVAAVYFLRGEKKPVVHFVACILSIALGTVLISAAILQPRATAFTFDQPAVARILDAEGVQLSEHEVRIATFGNNDSICLTDTQGIRHIVHNAAGIVAIDEQGGSK